MCHKARTKRKTHMKLKKLILSALVALTGAGWGVTSANAATTAYSPGDILIGFYASGGTGSATSYIVNVGPVSGFLSSTDPIDLGNISLDLKGTYGDGWATRNDLYWGIVGATGTVGNSAGIISYASQARTDVNTQADGWAAFTTSAKRNDNLSAINTLGGTYNGKTSTANNPNGLAQANSVSGGWAYQLTHNGTFLSAPTFANNSGWTGSEFLGNFANGADGTVLDLFSVGTIANTGYVGTFSINSDGDVFYNAVPEPSTYALMAIAGTFFAIFLRRRRTAQLAAVAN